MAGATFPLLYSLSIPTQELDRLAKTFPNLPLPCRTLLFW